MRIAVAIAAIACPAIAAAQAHDGLAERYAAACRALSATECRIGNPPSASDRAGLDCLFAELDRRAGDGTAMAHVAWAEGLAATGQPPGTGFPTTIKDQEILVAATIACRDRQN